MVYYYWHVKNQNHASLRQTKFDRSEKLNINNANNSKINLNKKKLKNIK